MREIGTLPNERLARRFADYSLTQGVEVMVESDGDQWSIWAYEEDQIDKAKQELAQFTAEPDDARYVEAGRTAENLRREAEKREEQLRKQQVDVRARWQRPTWAQCPVTTAMIAISVLVAVTTNLGEKHEPVRKALSITGYSVLGYYTPGLPEVRDGQVWRLVTPIFIHFGILHILFNMLWLRDLGMNIEFRRGSWRYALIVLAVAIPSNVGQYVWSGPTFGGMSGVVFGLFGYIWMKSRFEPESGFFIHPNVVFLMIGWFFLCMTGFVGEIANVAHGGGLVMGMLMGGAPALLKRVV